MSKASGKQQTFSACMRAHGVPKFPDANSTGGIAIDASSGVDPSLAAVPGGAEGLPEARAQRRQAAVRRRAGEGAGAGAQVLGLHARARRAELPRPDVPGGMTQISIDAKNGGIDPSSPIFQSAQKTCQKLMPGRPGRSGRRSDDPCRRERAGLRECGQVRRRWIGAAAAAALIAAAASRSRRRGASPAATRTARRRPTPPTTSLASVTRQTLSAADAGERDARLCRRGDHRRARPGRRRRALRQAQQSVTSAKGSLQAARTTLAADLQALASARARLAADRQKRAVDCRWRSAAQSPAEQAAGNGGGTLARAQPIRRRSPPTSNSSPRPGRRSRTTGSRLLCAGRARGRRGQPGRGRVLGHGLRRQLLLHVPARRRARCCGAARRCTASAMSPWSCCTAPWFRGERSSPACRPGRDVAELNANLRRLGYGKGLKGNAFTAATAAAIRSFQSAHVLAPTGRLLLGAVVFRARPGARHERDSNARCRGPARPGARRHLDRPPGHDQAQRRPAVGREGWRPGHDHAPGQPHDAGPRVVGRHRRHRAQRQRGRAGSQTRRRSRSTSRRRTRRRRATSIRPP